MKGHYFQRYHQKENVATANTLLLISRLYDLSPRIFFNFFRTLGFFQNEDLELSLALQKKDKKSIPDAVISQPGFKILIETKRGDHFDLKQLENHLEGFENEQCKYKRLLTLSSGPMPDNEKKELETLIRNCNAQLNTNCKDQNKEFVEHKHILFDDLIEAAFEVVDEKDPLITEIINDYQEYCYDSELISDAENRMRAHTSGSSMELNKELNLYYNGADKGWKGQNYIGLYANKAVRAIGKIEKIVVVESRNGSLEKLAFQPEKPEYRPTDEEKNRIRKAIDRAKTLGHNLLTSPQRFFLVDNFYETDFKAIDSWIQREKIFKLTDFLGKPLPESTEKIAELLKQKTWSKLGS